jgi:hypothetical protein
MIQANELRIGNWVIDHGGNNNIVQGIHGSGSVRFIDGEVCAVDKLNGIPLTPEILEKCGFEENENQTLYLGIDDYGLNWLEIIKSPDGFYPVIYQWAEMSNETPQSVHLNRVEYLHQLQNLYYALTGQELTFKEAIA